MRGTPAEERFVKITPCSTILWKEFDRVAREKKNRTNDQLEGSSLLQVDGNVPWFTASK